MLDLLARCWCHHGIALRSMGNWSEVHLNSPEPSWQMPGERPRRVFRKIRKGQVVLLVSLLLLYPVWIWPFGARILESFFRKEISQEMSPQEKDQVEGWNYFVILVLGAPHPEMFEMYYKSIASYRDAGRPDLAERVKVIGRILLWWQGIAFLAQFLFPILILKLIRDRELARVLTVAWLLNAFFILYASICL